MRARDAIDRPALAAVAAAGAAARNADLPPERKAAAPAVPGFDVDIDLVDEHQKMNRVIEKSSNRVVVWGIEMPIRNAITKLPDYPITRFRLLLFGKDADDPSARAVVFEAHPALDLREDRVVLADARVQTRPEPPSTLADDDGAARDEIAVVGLDAETLRIGVAAVT